MPSDAHVMRWQRHLLRAVSRGWIRVGDGVVPLPLYLDGVFRMQRLLRAPVGRRLRYAVGFHARADADMGSSTMPFESLSISQRRTQLTDLAILLDRWPERFVTVGRQACLRWSDMTEERSAHLPFWLERVGREHFDYTWYQPSTTELDAIGDFLKRHGFSSRATSVREWSGGWVQVRRASVAPLPLHAPAQLRIRAVPASTFSEELRAAWVRRLVTALRRYCARKSQQTRIRVHRACLQVEFVDGQFERPNDGDKSRRVLDECQE